jgi:hypothetical protein
LVEPILLKNKLSVVWNASQNCYRALDLAPMASLLMSNDGWSLHTILRIACCCSFLAAGCLGDR